MLKPDYIIKTKPQGEVLEQYMDSMARVSIVIGPLGSAKTTQSCQKILNLMCGQEPNADGVRPTRFVAVRNTFPELLGTTAKDWLEMFGDLGAWKGGGLEPPEHKIEFFLTDGTLVKTSLIFIALDRPQHVRKLRGVQVTGFWLSEAKELSKAIVDMADLRHGRYPSLVAGRVMCSWHGMIGDTNSPDEDNWVYKLAEEVKPKDWVFFRQPGGVIKKQGKWIPNPNAENLNNLAKNYYLAGLEGKSDDWIAVNLGNEYGIVIDGKPVHPEYNDSVHCVDDVDYLRGTTIILGIDLGRTPACSIMQEISGSWVILDEFVTVNMSAAKFAPALLRHLTRNYPGEAFVGWADPAGANKGEVVERSAIEMLNALGVPCEPCETNDTLQRRAAIANPLTELNVQGKPRLLVCKKAKTIRKGLAGKFCYRRMQVAGDEKFMDVPDKNEWSHAVEGAEYGLMGEGEGVAAVLATVKREYKKRDNLAR